VQITVRPQSPEIKFYSTYSQVKIEFSRRAENIRSLYEFSCQRSFNKFRYSIVDESFLKSGHIPVRSIQKFYRYIEIAFIKTYNHILYIFYFQPAPLIPEFIRTSNVPFFNIIQVTVHPVIFRKPLMIGKVVLQIRKSAAGDTLFIISDIEDKENLKTINGPCTILKTANSCPIK